MKRLVVTALALSIAGCGTAREPRVERMARVACDRFAECGSLEANYGSYSECTSDMEAQFYDLWPAGQCGDGQMDGPTYRDCLDRAAVYSCNATVIDFLSFVDSCSADDVCID